MRVLVVVPTRDRWGSLARCLSSIQDSLRTLDPGAQESIEVLVVDDRSGPELQEKVATQFPGVKVERSSGVGPGAARNTALERSGYDGVFFTDSDCEVAEDWLCKGLEWLSRGTEALAQGPPWHFQRRSNPKLGSLEASLYRHLFLTYVRNGTCRQIDSRNLLIRTTDWSGRLSIRFPRLWVQQQQKRESWGSSQNR